MPRARNELRALGYDLVSGSTSSWDSNDAEHTALRVVDERYLDRVPTVEEDRRTPLALLTGARPLDIEDPRIVGRVRRPADTLSLYPLFQQALEEHPRKVPRVPTQLPARCIREDRRWPGAVLSLSEGGCLLRTSESLETGLRFNLQFAIPGGQLVTARARCVYSSDESAGLSFCQPSDVDLRMIRGYVSERLAYL
ncbi:MAG: PilZ domain-containing protein [Myxococcota bacterium]